MTAGIYLITFQPSGSTYIGKSKDLSTRWKQHMDKLAKSKHADKVQEVYDSSTNMTFEVILECHEDHIDIMEAYFINRFSPDLNTQIPKSEYNWGNVGTEFLKLSTYEHYQKLRWAATRIEELSDKLENAREEIDEFRYQGEQGKILKEAEDTVDYLSNELSKWETAPWWKRLFM